MAAHLYKIQSSGFVPREKDIQGCTIFPASLQDGTVSELRIAEDQFRQDFDIGELHITVDQKVIYFHSSRPGGKGLYDIWVTRRENAAWQEPEYVEAVNSAESHGWPYVTKEENELWFSRTYQGTLAICRSVWSGNLCSEPELIISQFAGEPTLDEQGILYFVHHFISGGNLVGADIYVAYRR